MTTNSIKKKGLNCLQTFPPVSCSFYINPMHNQSFVNISKLLHNANVMFCRFVFLKRTSHFVQIHFVTGLFLLKDCLPHNRTWNVKSGFVIIVGIIIESDIVYQTFISYKAEECSLSNAHISLFTDRCSFKTCCLVREKLRVRHTRSL